MNMTIQTAKLAPPSADLLPRSTGSLTFQDFWSGLRRDGLVPRRQDFHPARAVGFLRDIVLIEVPDNDASAMRVRVTGSAIDVQAGNSIAGRSYLEFVPEHLHAGLLKSVRLMLDHPCGLWQVMPTPLRSPVSPNRPRSLPFRCSPPTTDRRWCSLL